MQVIHFKTGLYILSAIALILGAPVARGDSINIAVASNFRVAITPLVQRFETDTNHEVTLIFGSTGKHYAQIIHGAPFDLFLAADTRRPGLLEEQRIAVEGSRFTYALGRLVLWSSDPDLVDQQGSVLESGRFNYLAIANPKLAPYGLAAKQVLQARDLWKALQSRLVRGENITQAFQYVDSANAELGFIAYSQLKNPATPMNGSLWQPPQALYTPIEQQAVVLSDIPAVWEFAGLLKSEIGRQIIAEHGYGLP